MGIVFNIVAILMKLSIGRRSQPAFGLYRHSLNVEIYQ